MCSRRNLYNNFNPLKYKQKNTEYNPKQHICLLNIKDLILFSHRLNKVLSMADIQSQLDLNLTS